MAVAHGRDAQATNPTGAAGELGVQARATAERIAAEQSAANTPIGTKKVGWRGYAMGLAAGG